MKFPDKLRDMGYSEEDLEQSNPYNQWMQDTKEIEMNDKNTIINMIVEHAADIMEAKAEYNKLVSDQIKEKPIVSVHNKMTSDRLDAQNALIMSAVNLMRQNSGCWS